MVARLVEVFDHGDLAPRIERSTGDHLGEQVRIDEPRARERREMTPGHEQAKCEPVQVFVAAARRADLRGRRRELGRVEHDEIEGGSGVAEFAKIREDVGLDPFDRGDAVEVGIVASDARAPASTSRRSRHSPRRRASPRRRTRRCSRTSSTRAAATRSAGDETAVVPLIEVEARLVSAADIDQIATTVFDDLHIGRWFGARE